MNGNPRQNDSTQPLSDAAQADMLCAEFARAWRIVPETGPGTGPRIEDWLDRAPPKERRLLFCELLEIELHARQQRGDLPAEEEYVGRFPDQQEAISALFAKWVRKRLGDYDILREIGHGGMGIVYQAQHRLLDQVVAIKLLPESSLGDVQAVRRFQREMLSIGRLNHPNIVRALNAGEERGVPYLVMEFIEGLDFRDLVNESGRLGPEAACELIRQAAVGLQHIHEHGLVHRDIKPANLILARDAAVKILDLGLVRLETLPTSRELTQPGMPMGTVDYMAPEQWVDPSAVDIRADIYALGCTLFFLLTGQPPSAMAARRTPFPRRSEVQPTHPSVASLRRDCPQDLDKILELMLAEEPDERFDTPGEVADAIGVFADSAALDPLVSVCIRASAPDRGKSAAGSIVPTTTWANAARRSPPGGVGRTRARSARRRLGWGIEAIGAVALSLVVLAIWLALRFVGDGRPASGLPDQADREPSRVAAELAALPGLNGHWWFDETPWLIPNVRDYLARSAASAAATDGAEQARGPEGHEGQWLWQPNVCAVQDQLLKLVRPSLDKLSPAESALIADLLALSQQDLGDEPLAAQLRAALDRFQQAKAAVAWSAVDLHTRAVLQHKIATIHSDLELAKRAAESYDAALAAYGAEDTVDAALRARCLADSGLFYANVFKDYPEARRRFREARPLAGVARLLIAETWFSEGVASAVANPHAADKYAEAGAALTQARQVIQEAGPALSNHPLLAHVHERHAWILMDQWNVLRASQEFQEARNIRFDNYWKSKNDFAQIFVFHNDHGLAMAERYCGDERIARAKYELVIGEVEKALAQAETQPDRPGGQRFRRDLRERWSNSCERRADCELYGGAASGAPVDLKEAARLYAVARDQADDPAVQIAMSCKRSIVLALDGQVAEARQEISTRVAQQTVIGVHEERVRLLRRLAEATLLLKDADGETGLPALRAFLRAFDLDANYPDRHRRETQELQLLAAELLIATQREQTLGEAAVADLNFLDRLIVAFPYRDQMLPYLRRYYDLAVDVIAASDPQRAAGYILAARDQRPAPDATMLLFHFEAARGRAILHHNDTSTHFPLDFGRDDVRQAAATGQPSLSLPQELVELVSADMRAERSVVLYWSDGRCWSRAENALSRKDWPFGSQLDVEKLAEPATGNPPVERAAANSLSKPEPAAARPTPPVSPAQESGP